MSRGVASATLGNVRNNVSNSFRDRAGSNGTRDRATGKYANNSNASLKT